jgi:hypothetical protein
MYSSDDYRNYLNVQNFHAVYAWCEDLSDERCISCLALMSICFVSQILLLVLHVTVYDIDLESIIHDILKGG